MPTLFLLVASVAAVVYAAVALYLARTKTNGEEEGFALTGALAFFGGVVGLLLHVALAFGPDLREYCHEHLPWWLGAVLQGAVAGLLVSVGWRAWQLAGSAYWWARGRPVKTTGFVARRHLWAVVAVALAFVAISAPDPSAANPLGWYNLMQWLMVLVVFCAMPTYRTWLLPWIIYQRGETLDASEHAEIHQWLGTVRKAHNVPKIDVLVQEGKAGKCVHAMAASGPRRHFVVLSRGLLQRLPVEHVEAILAHEIGHVMNGDTARRPLLLFLLIGCLHMLYFKLVVLPMDNLWIEVPCVAFGASFFLVILPLIFQRHWEYQADRKAVELTGNAEVVAQSLLRFYKVNNFGIDKPGYPHPSLRARLQAIRCLDAKSNDNTNTAA